MNIIGLNESLGIPFRYKGSIKSMHDHIIEGVYQNLKDDTNFYLNAFSMFFNKTHHIKDIITHNLNVKEIKLLIKYGNDAARNNFFTKVAIPKSLGNIDKIKENDCNHHIVDILSKNHNLILYACGVNDIMYEMNACFYNVLFDKERKKKALDMLKKNDMIEHTLKKVEENFKIFLSINPNTTIFVFNFSIDLYCPNLILKINQNWNSMNILRDFVERYNNSLKELVDKYHFVYIDNRKQFNIKKRTKELITFISTYPLEKNKKFNDFEYDDLGIEGFLKDQEKLLSFYESKKALKDKVVVEKIEEHTLEINIIKKIMEVNHEKDYN